MIEAAFDFAHFFCGKDCRSRHITWWCGVERTRLTQIKIYFQSRHCAYMIRFAGLANVTIGNEDKAVPVKRSPHDVGDHHPSAPMIDTEQNFY